MSSQEPEECPLCTEGTPETFDTTNAAVAAFVAAAESGEWSSGQRRAVGVPIEGRDTATVETLARELQTQLSAASIAVQNLEVTITEGKDKSLLCVSMVRCGA